MKRILPTIILLAVFLTSCASVDLEAPLPVFETGVDPEAWAQIPAGEFFYGQFDEEKTTDAYEIMVTNVTTTQYASYLNDALAAGAIKVDGDQILGYYPGDEFHAYEHEEKIEAGDWLLIPLNDPAQRVKFDGATFSVQAGYENHPMTMVTWFGAWNYCGYYDWRLPTEIEWEKAARGTDNRPFPWGHEIARENANFYASRDPFEEMSTFGSRTYARWFFQRQYLRWLHHTRFSLTIRII